MLLEFKLPAEVAEMFETIVFSVTVTPDNQFGSQESSILIRINPDENCGGNKTAEGIRDCLTVLTNSCYIPLTKKTLPPAIAVLRAKNIASKARQIERSSKSVGMVYGDGPDTLYLILFPEPDTTIDEFMQESHICCEENGLKTISYVFRAKTAQPHKEYQYTGELYKY